MYRLGVLLVIFFCVLKSAKAEVDTAGESSLQRVGAKVWEVKLSKKFKSLSVQTEIDMPTSEDTVPTLYVRLRSKSGEEVIKFRLYDEVCTGEYDLTLSYDDSKSGWRYRNVDALVQWPEVFDIKLEYVGKKNWKHIYKIIVNEELFDVIVGKKVVLLQAVVKHGFATFENLNIVNR